MADVGRGLAVSGALLGVAAVVETLVHPAGDAGPVQYVLIAVVLALASTVPLALPRAAMAAGTVTLAGLTAHSVLGAVTVAGALAQLIAGYRLGFRGPVWFAVALGPPWLAAAALGSSGYPRLLAIGLAALVPVAALAGVARRLSRQAAQDSAARQALAGTLLEHTARGERARIARELHDVVAHHISMIAIQAETGRLTTPGLPSAGAQRFAAIGDTARDALTEMRRLLGVLRADAEPTPVPARAPQPGLRQLTDLLDEARTASGAGTRLILTGAPVPLDPGVELAAYRIVQEALTNARRHAAGAAVDVELHFGADALGLVIRDNGPGPAGSPEPGGHGLLGMTERAAAVGGDLRAGAASGGGFLVRATLPAKGATP